MALAAINVKKPREAQIWNCCIGNPVLRILPDSNNSIKCPLIYVPPPEVLPFSSSAGTHRCRKGVRARGHGRIRRPSWRRSVLQWGFGQWKCVLPVWFCCQYGLPLGFEMADSDYFIISWGYFVIWSRKSMVIPLLSWLCQCVTLGHPIGLIFSLACSARCFFNINGRQSH